MLKLLHTKLDKPKLLTTFPNNSTGNDGDIVISTISGKGTYICVKSNGRWYAANKMEDLSNIGKSSFNKLLLKKLTVKEVENAGSDTDKFLVLDAGNQLKFRTGSETLSDIGAGTSSVGALNELSDVTYSSGDLTISSLDTIVSGALTIDSSDDIELNADGGNIIFKDDTDTMLDIQTTNLKSEVPLLIKESADAIADSAGYGQLWVDTATPNELAFTDDAGTDIIGVGKYHYETKFIGFYAGQTAQYIPMTGYIIEKTSTGSNNEFISFVTPYNCTIEKFIYRSEVAQDGTFSLRILESSDATEVPSSVIYRKDTTIDIDDDTFLDYDLTSPSTGSDYAPLTKGKIYAIYVATPAVGYDSNITVVFKWDITS